MRPHTSEGEQGASNRQRREGVRGVSVVFCGTYAWWMHPWFMATPRPPPTFPCPLPTCYHNQVVSVCLPRRKKCTRGKLPHTDREIPWHRQPNAPKRDPNLRDEVTRSCCVLASRVRGGSPPSGDVLRDGRRTLFWQKGNSVYDKSARVAHKSTRALPILLFTLHHVASVGNSADSLPCTCKITREISCGRDTIRRRRPSAS